MNLISKLMISFLELMEAEGRMFRRNVTEVTEFFLCRFFGGILLLLSFTAAVSAMYIWLEDEFGEIAALSAVAAVLFIPGIWLFSLARKSDSAKEEENTASALEKTNEK